jgi:hypothetical protein
VATDEVMTRGPRVLGAKRAKPTPARLVAPAGEEQPEELVVTAAKQLTLRCGEASITLTAAGKIIIRGKYIVSRSSGVQRIKGGSVQIN